MQDGDGRGDRRRERDAAPDAAPAPAAAALSCSSARACCGCCVFFAIPLVNQVDVSLQTRRPGATATRSPGTSRPTRDAICDYDDAVRAARSATRASRRSSCLIIAFPLAYFIAFKAGRCKNADAAADHPAVLHELRAADGGLAADPVRQRLGRAPPARRRPARRRRAAAGLAHGGDRGHHLQLPAVHGAAAVRVAGEDRPAADRGGDRPLRQPRDRVPQGDAAAGAARASSPARC